MHRSTAGTREAREKESAEKKAKKDAARIEREKAEKIKTRSWQALLGGAAICTVIMSTWALFTISRATIQTVHLNDESKLKEVFFGGEPWLLQCSNENATVTDAFASAARKLSVTAAINVGAIDCAGKLPSNRTFFQRFKLPPVNFTQTPTGYLFANTDSPLQIPDKWMKDGSKLADWAQKYSKPSLKEVAWEKTFSKYCLMRDHCVMVHTKGKYKPPKWLPSVMAKHRTVRFVSINRNHHKTSFDDKVKVPRKEDVPRLAVLARTRAEKEGGADTYTLTPHRGEWSEPAVAALLTSILDKGEAHKDSTVLEETPWFDVPPKRSSNKARDENKEYRERQRRERAKRAQEGAGGEAESSSSRQRKSAEEDEEDEEKRRKEAVRRAEEQLEDDDDVVVSDIDDDDEDDRLV